jgi:hypothetical protein
MKEETVERCGNWRITFDPDQPEYLQIKHNKHPGFVLIKAETEGFVVDIWDGQAFDVVATAAALYSDLAEGK